MSSFRRTKLSGGAKSEKASGVKSGKSGQSFVSCGNKQLDDIIGGGIGMGTIMLLEEDDFSSYGETIMIYNITQSIIHQHMTVIACSSVDEAAKLLDKLPYSLTQGTSEEEEIDSSTKGLEELKIAWQYGKYLDPDSTENSSVTGRIHTPLAVSTVSSVSLSATREMCTRSFCESFDLSRSLQENIRKKAIVRIIPTAVPTDVHNSLSEWLSRLFSIIHTLLLQLCESDTHITRLYIPDLFQVIDMFSINNLEAERLILQTILSLKHFIRNKKIILLLTVQPSVINPYLLQSIGNIADTVVAIDSFAGRANITPVEFREFCGFLIVRKIAHMSAIVPHRPAHIKYGLKRDRRKLHIEPLHLPPEESRAMASISNNSNESAAFNKASSGDASSHGGAAPLQPGLACASSGPYGKNLDF